MNKRQLQQFETHLKTSVMLRDYLKTNTDRALELMAAEFGQTVDALRRQVEIQDTARMMRAGSSSETVVARRRLNAQMEKIASVARLPDLKEMPGVEILKRVTPKRASAKRLVAAANAMTKAITPAVAREYQRRGWAAGMAARLRDATRDFQSSVKETGQESNRRALATADLRRLFSKAGRQRDAIKAMLGERFYTDRTLRRTWKYATRIGPPKGRPTDRRRRGKGEAGAP